ncbi:unnamed protein product [Rotaria socialis]|uniref:TIR domain-containing protein n=1 Tax=Rotaria socialis TaxID=392032 RepID=A0A818JSL9_9BILA|nr:unnamed protein product [Rotaria socialis]CAF4478531.1 unnamed protein product [Rotaria socialis]
MQNHQPNEVSASLPDQSIDSTFEKLIARLEQCKSAPKSTVESKKKIWSEFLPIWADILQFTPDEATLCYEKCTQVLGTLLQSVNFFSIKREVDIARQSLFTCITQLNRAHFKEFLQLPEDKEKSNGNQIYFAHLEKLLFVAAQCTLYVNFTTIDEQQFIAEHTELIIVLIERVDRAMPEHADFTIQKDHSLGSLIESILSLLWNLADRTVLVPTILKCGLSKRVVSWLRQAPMINDKGRRPFISIAHNISRHDDGADELNQLGAIPIIKQYQSIKTTTVDARNLVAIMTLALLSTPDQIKQDKKGMNATLNQLLQLVIGAAKGDRLRCNGFHVSEPLGVLVKMFVVEERTLDYILCHAETDPPSDIVSTISLFISLFMTFGNAFKGISYLEQFTLIALLNIFWSISFQANYAQELANNEQLIKKIRSLLDDEKEQEILEQYKPRSMEGALQAARGILHNLNFDNRADVNIEELNRRHESDRPECLEKYNDSLSELPLLQKSKEVDIPWIMISYCHADDTFCSRILELFSTRSETFHIWIDRTHCQTAIDLWESIAEGMESASVIVCLLSNSYLESKSCRQEFVYAIDSLKKPVLPVLLGNFDPKGWLGIRMSGLKYVRFRDLLQPDSSKLTELVNTVISSLPQGKTMAIKHLSSPQHHDPPISTVSVTLLAPLNLRPFDQLTWSVEDIHNWFAYHHISRELRDLFDFQNGEEMLDYAQLLTKDREKQMKIYSNVYAKKYAGNEMAPHDFIRFSKALKQLFKEHQPVSSVIEQKSSMQNKTSVCTIL